MAVRLRNKLTLEKLFGWSLIIVVAVLEDLDQFTINFFIMLCTPNRSSGSQAVNIDTKLPPTSCNQTRTTNTVNFRIKSIKALLFCDFFVVNSKSRAIAYYS